MLRPACALLALVLAAPAAAQLFEARSPAGGKMDIVIREIERRPRASVLAFEIRDVGSSVGSSFFLLCSIRNLAQARGGFRHIAKLEDYPQRRQMLIGFLKNGAEPPENLAPEFAGAQAIELDQFAPICDRMQR